MTLPKFTMIFSPPTNPLFFKSSVTNSLDPDQTKKDGLDWGPNCLHVSFQQMAQVGKELVFITFILIHVIFRFWDFYKLQSTDFQNPKYQNLYVYK